MVWIVIGSIVLCGVLWGPVVSNVEQAQYKVIESHGKIEIRDYTPMIVAETTVPGEREEAINLGFRTIADYIFGNNQASQNVAMTSPVMQKSSEKIAMTAPVIQQPNRNLWTVSFVMPSRHSMKTLPKPNNQRVSLRELPERRFAVISFSGLADRDTLLKQTEDLKSFVTSKKLTVASEPAYAFFNPPWTLPFLRRNEVMLEVVR